MSAVVMLGGAAKTMGAVVEFVEFDDCIMAKQESKSMKTISSNDLH